MMLEVCVCVFAFEREKRAGGGRGQGVREGEVVRVSDAPGLSYTASQHGQRRRRHASCRPWRALPPLAFLSVNRQAHSTSQHTHHFTAQHTHHFAPCTRNPTCTQQPVERVRTAWHWRAAAITDARTHNSPARKKWPCQIAAQAPVPGACNPPSLVQTLTHAHLQEGRFIGICPHAS